MLFMGGGPPWVLTSGLFDAGGGPPDELSDPHATTEQAIVAKRRTLAKPVFRQECRVCRLVIWFINKKVPDKYHECVLK